ncbi:MAG: TIM44-like domain-containing protein [Kofleriaceae bacterium]
MRVRGRGASGGLGVAALVVIGLAFAGAAWARPGGGESYSGGGGHGDGGGGGDGGLALELVFQLLRLCFYYPKIGLPLLAIVVGVLIYSAYRKAQNKDWDSGPPVPLARAASLEDLRRIDPEFSQVVFEDFAFRLFAAAHRARRSEAELAAVAPYVSEAARRALLARAPAGQAVGSVVVGAMRTIRLSLPEGADAAGADGPGPSAASPAGAAGAGQVRMVVEFEANVTTVPAAGAAAKTYFSVERWTFSRAADARSRPPDAKGFPCPVCGAPWQAAATGTQVCASCNTSVDNGRFDWTVEDVVLASIDERPPTLTEEVRERGTELPTYYQAGFDKRWLALLDSDPELRESAVLARLRLIFDQLNAAWSKGELREVRGLVSDGLYDSLQYWIEAYRASGLRNELVGMRITHTVVCKLVRDRYYDALTVRLWGTGKDFVVRTATGEVVRGSKHRDRAYSEYWTLIRAAGRKGAAHPVSTCGNCGAPLTVSMAGACEHCGAHLTRGEFDWVLSKIEQDDSYRG